MECAPMWVGVLVVSDSAGGPLFNLLVGLAASLVYVNLVRRCSLNRSNPHSKRLELSA